jgi:hypothetical protein
MLPMFMPVAYDFFKAVKELAVAPKVKNRGLKSFHMSLGKNTNKVGHQVRRKNSLSSVPSAILEHYFLN